MFWIHLDKEEKLGGVQFKLYGQACDKCGSDDEPTFCPPMWYPEEVVKVCQLIVQFYTTVSSVTCLSVNLLCNFSVACLSNRECRVHETRAQSIFASIAVFTEQ